MYDIELALNVIAWCMIGVSGIFAYASLREYQVRKVIRRRLRK